MTDADRTAKRNSSRRAFARTLDALIGMAQVGLFAGALIIAVGTLVGHYHPTFSPAQYASQMFLVGLGFLKLGDLLKSYLIWMVARAEKNTNTERI